MKEFSTAVSEVEAEEERALEIAARERRVQARVETGASREEAEAAEAEVDDEGVITFKLDDRTLKAFPPTEGQLAFMMAALGRGQSTDQRFASIINIMLAAMRDEDQDYLEGRLLAKKDDPKRLRIQKLEEIFEYLTEEWFARPTQ